MDELLGTLLSFLDGEEDTEEPKQTPSAMPDPSVLLKMASVMGELTQETDDTRLLYALQPFLRPDRRAKVDEAANLCRLMRLLPKLMEDDRET